MRCRNCGEEVSENQIKCPYCDTSFCNELDTCYNQEVLQHDSALDKLNDGMDKLGMIVDSASDIAITIADMRIQIATVEAQVDAFCHALDTDLAKYEQRLPMLERQLNRASDRIDKFVDKILNEDGDSTSPEYLQRQSMLLDALADMSNQFNTIIMKLL